MLGTVGKPSDMLPGKKSGNNEGSRSRIFKPPRVRIRRSSKEEVGRTQSDLTTKSGQVRRAQKGLFVHYCDICSKGPYSRREHLNRHKKRHFDLTRKCRVCGKIFKEDDFLQKHMKIMHPDLVELPDLKTESSFADEELGAKIEPPGSLAEAANVGWFSGAGYLTCTSTLASLPAQPSLSSNARLLPSGSRESGEISPVYACIEPLNSMADKFCLTKSDASEKSQSSSEKHRSSGGTPAKSSLHNRYIYQYFLSRSGRKQDTLNWPFSRCQHPAAAMLRRLVCDFSSIYGKEWMGELFCLNSRQNGIDQSLFAVTAMWQSRMKKDTPLRRKALTVYQAAILNVKEQLTASRLNQPFVLVAMSMIFAATEAQIDDGVDQLGWVTHIKGALAVLSTTDPQIWTSFSHIRLFIDLRYMAVLAFLASRKPFSLANTEWRDITWPQSFRTIRETLIDELVVLPGLLCECAKLQTEMKTRSIPVRKEDLLQVRHLIEAISRCEMRLKLWFQGLQSPGGSPPYWRRLSSTSMPLSSTDKVIAIWFPNALTAESITLYWASQLLIYLSVIDLYDSSPPQFCSPPKETPESGNLEASSGPQRNTIFSNDLGTYDAEFERYWPPSAADARNLAIKLGQCLEYMMSDAFQPLNGARLACVPLWPAIRLFSRYPPGPELKWCQTIAELLAEKTGLFYVSKITTNSEDVMKRWNSEGA